LIAARYWFKEQRGERRTPTSCPGERRSRRTVERTKDEFEDLRELAARVVAAREAAGLTQLALAEAAGVAPRYVQQIEAGRGNPSYLKVLAIARALGRHGKDARESPLAGRPRGPRSLAAFRVAFVVLLFGRGGAIERVVATQRSRRASRRRIASMWASRKSFVQYGCWSSSPPTSKRSIS
jgi:transcriptional regulator with XRE-family HTH domain